MGHGSSSLTDRNVGTAGNDISELPGYSYEKTLGSGRFLKTIRARHRKGTAVVKIFIKPGPGYSLHQYLKRIERMVSTPTFSEASSLALTYCIHII